MRSDMGPFLGCSSHALTAVDAPEPGECWCSSMTLALLERGLSRTFQRAQTCAYQPVRIRLVSAEEWMPKSEVLRGARWKRRAAGRAELPDALEGQVEEICRDLSEQVKRMRQLQEQADELRTALREWAYPGGAIVRTD